jgi:Spy/CpxP family protein refolding chaperone
MEPLMLIPGLIPKTEDKKMKKLFFSLLSFLLLSLTASSLYAQGMGGGYGMGMHKPFQHLERLQYAFDLTNAQVDKIYKIDKDYMDKFYQNRNDPDKIRELREKHFTDIESILTAEQKTKWNEFKKDRPMKGRDDGFRPGFGSHPGMGMFQPDFIQKDLGLTAEQADKIYKIRRDNMDKFYQNRNDGDKVRELRAKQDAEIETVLTTEQKAKWNELKQRPPEFRDKPGKGKWKQGHPCWDDRDE